MTTGGTAGTPRHDATHNRRVAVVTGGAGTLGRAIARRLAADGSDAVLLDIDADAAAEEAERLATETGRRIEGWSVDVTDSARVRESIMRLASTFGRLDQLVNNAGANRRARLSTVSRDGWDDVMAVNLWAPTALCQAAMDIWRDGSGARVVNIGSRTWLSGGPVDYATSKAGLVGLTRSLAVELGPLNVTVNSVAPSMMATPFTSQGLGEQEFTEFVARHSAMTSLQRLATPEDVAHAVSFLVSEGAGFITGETLHVCGGAQLAPTPPAILPGTGSGHPDDAAAQHSEAATTW